MDGTAQFRIRRCDLLKMSLPIKYRLICEGPSEWTYLQRLAAFIVDKLPPMEDGFTPRLSFSPSVTNDKIGGGSFKLVQRAYRKVWPQNKKLPLRIWVDCDIYIRNSSACERANAAGYAQKKTMPDFNFMVMNFEDFIAMHFPDDVFEAWKVEMQNAGHFTVPLHSVDYEPLFEKIWQQFLQSVGSSGVESYKKGSLPEDFVTEVSLTNMLRHCQDLILSPLFVQYAPVGAFPLFLSDAMRSAYPEVFV